MYVDDISIFLVIREPSDYIMLKKLLSMFCEWCETNMSVYLREQMYRDVLQSFETMNIMNGAS